MYELGYYTEDAKMEKLRTAKTREEAKQAYDILHDLHKCTIWILKVEKVNPKDL
jgi:predicted nucleotidyltransferase component of viral defense system